ncbi:MAG TPA: AMP-binding protein, partial [Caulobacteraceae bacterium]
MTLHAALAEGARAFPDRPWVSCENQTWSYAEGGALTDRLAQGLMAAEIGPGDRVALLFANSPELIFSYYACWKIGAIAVPLNIRFAPPELAYALGHCEARILLGQEDLCRAVIPMQAELPHLSAVHVTGDALEGARRFEALCEDRPGEPAALPSVDAHQMAALLYTSGTTARPKGVIHTHAGLCQQAENFFDALGRNVFERTVISTPLYHASGFGSGMLPVTQAGGSMWIVRRFEPEAVLCVIESSRATYSGNLPVQVRILVDHP